MHTKKESWRYAVASFLKAGKETSSFKDVFPCPIFLNMLGVVSGSLAG